MHKATFISPRRWTIKESTVNQTDKLEDGQENSTEIRRVEDYWNRDETNIQCQTSKTTLDWS